MSVVEHCEPLRYQQVTDILVVVCVAIEQVVARQARTATARYRSRPGSSVQGRGTQSYTLDTVTAPLRSVTQNISIY